MLDTIDGPEWVHNIPIHPSQDPQHTPGTHTYQEKTKETKIN